MTQELHDLQEFVGARLDAGQMLQYLGVSEIPRPVGDLLKVHCPVHRGTDFRSLRVDLRTNRCQCLVRGCAAHRGVGMVELAGLVRGWQPAEAALRLASQFHIDVPPYLVHRSALRLAEQAAAIMDGPDPSQAFALWVLVGRMASDDDRLAEQAADGLATLDAPHEAVRIWFRESARRHRLGQLDEAIRLLKEKALPLDPNHEDVLNFLVECLRLENPAHYEWAEVLHRLAQLRLRAGRRDEALQDMREAIQAHPRPAALREQAAQLLRALNEPSEARMEYWYAAGAYEAEGQDEAALRCLEMVAELNPEDVAALERALELRQRLGQMDQYLDHLREMGRRALHAGDKERAAEAFLSLVLRRPEEIEPRQQLASLLEQAHDIHGAAEHGIVAVRLLLAAGKAEQAMEQLTHAEELAVEDPALLHQIGELLERCGEPRRAYSCFVRTGLGFLAETNGAGARLAFRDALRCLEESGAEGEAEGVVELAQGLAATGQRDHARDLFLRMVRRAAGSADHKAVAEAMEAAGQHDLLQEEPAAALMHARALQALCQPRRAAQAIFPHLRHMGPDLPQAVLLLEEVWGLDAEKRQLLVEQLKEAGFQKEATASARRWVKAAMKAEDWEAALPALQVAAAAAPADGALLEQWAQVLDHAGDSEEAPQVQARAAAVYLDSSDPLAAATAARRAVAMDPDSRRPLELLVAAYLAQGTQGLDQLLQFLPQAPNPVLLAQLLALRLQQETTPPPQLSQCLEALLPALENHPLTAEESLGVLLQRQPGRRELLKQLAALQEARPAPAADLDRTRRALAQAALEAGEADEAERILAKMAPGTRPPGRLEKLRAERALAHQDWPLLVETTAAQAATLEGEEAQAALLLERAAMLRKNGANPQAISLLRKFPAILADRLELLRPLAEALEMMQASSEAAASWAQYAELASTSGELDQAFLALKRAGNLDPEEPSHKEQLLRLLQEQSQHDQEEIVGTLVALARLNEKRGNLDEAIGYFESALRRAPEHLEAMIPLIGLLRRQGQTQRLETLIFSAAELAEKTADLLAVRDHFQQKLKDDPANEDALRQLADLEERAGSLEGALALRLQLGQVLEARSAFDEAIALYQSVAEQDEANTLVRQRMFEIHLAAGATEQAAHCLRDVQRIHMDAGNLSLAIETMRRVETLDPGNPETLESLGILYEQIHDEALTVRYLVAAAQRFAERGDTGKALNLLAQVLAIRPRHHPAVLLRAELLAENGDEARAVASLKEYLDELGTEEEAALPLRREILEKGLAIEPDDLALREELATLLSSDQDDEGAADQFFLLALTHQRQNRRDSCLQALQTGLQLAPDHYDLRQQHAQFLLAEEHWEDAGAAVRWLAAWHQGNLEYESALAQLRRLPAEHRSASWYMQEAHLLERLEDRSGAEKAFLAAAEKARAGQQPEVEDAGLRGALRYQPADKQLIERLTALLAENGPQDNEGALTALVLESFGRLLEAGDVEAALAVRDQLPDSLRRKRSLQDQCLDLILQAGIPELAVKELLEMIRLAQEDEADEEALALAQRILELQPLNVLALEHEFTALLRLQRVEEARDLGARLVLRLQELELLERATVRSRDLVALQPASPEFRQQLVDLLLEQDDRTSAVDELRQLADLYQQQGDLPRAAEAYQRLLSLRPDDTRARIYYIDTYRQVGPEENLVDDYLRLAEVHARHGAMVEATRAYEKAAQLAPDRLEVSEAMLDFLFANGQETRALEEAYALVGRFLKAALPRRALELLDRIGPTAGKSATWHEQRAAVQLAANAKGLALRDLAAAAALRREAGQRDQETAIVRQMTALDPHDTQMLGKLAALLLERGEKQEALAQLRRLAQVFQDRGLPDLAETELRRACSIDPDNVETRRALIDARLQVAGEADVLDDLAALGDVLARQGNAQEAMAIYRRALETHPLHVPSLRGIVTHYPKIGELSDIVDEILNLAQALVEAGKVEEGARYFQLVMSVDPQNTVAREMISATQSSPLPDWTGRESPADFYDFNTPAPQERPDRQPSSAKIPDSASHYLEGELNEMEQEESRHALSQVVANYRDILAVNSGNAAIRVKLADVLQQMGDIPAMLSELDQAIEVFVRRGDLPPAIAAAERYLAHRPSDARMRRRLNEAILKNDQMRALESSILYTERESRRSGDS